MTDGERLLAALDDQRAGVDVGWLPAGIATLLAHVADGRDTGHGPAVCSECGMVSLLSIVNGSGTSRGRPSVPWPKCLDHRCSGRRTIRPEDIDGVARIKYRAAPRRGAQP